MNKMQETETSNARVVGRFVASAMPGNSAGKALVTCGLFGGIVAVLGLLAFAAGKTSSNPSTAAIPTPPRQDVRMADRIHQQGPRSHRLVPFRVTQSGTIDIDVHVFDLSLIHI